MRSIIAFLAAIVSCAPWVGAATTGTDITVPEGYYQRFDCLVPSMDFSASARCIVVIAGVSDEKDARYRLVVEERKGVLAAVPSGGGKSEHVAVGFELIEGMAFVSLEANAGAPLAVGRWFPVIWMNSIIAGAEGTELVLEALPASTRTASRFNLYLVEGSDDAVTYYTDAAGALVPQKLDHAAMATTYLSFTPFGVAGPTNTVAERNITDDEKSEFLCWARCIAKKARKLPNDPPGCACSDFTLPQPLP